MKLVTGSNVLPRFSFSSPSLPFPLSFFDGVGRGLLCSALFLVGLTSTIMCGTLVRRFLRAKQAFILNLNPSSPIRANSDVDRNLESTRPQAMRLAFEGTFYVNCVEAQSTRLESTAGSCSEAEPAAVGCARTAGEWSIQLLANSKAHLHAVCIARISDMAPSVTRHSRWRMGSSY